MIEDFVLAGRLTTSDISDAFSPTAYLSQDEWIPSINGAEDEIAPESVSEPFPFQKHEYETLDIKSTVTNGHHVEVRAGQTALRVHWEQKLFKRLPFPRHWESEGIARPNIEAKMRCLRLLEQLERDYHLIPDSIAASIEEGICITYDRISAREDHSLIIEIYNDLTMALIVTDNQAKKTIYREDVQGMDVSRAVEIFQNPRFEDTAPR
jgi:hypothetical protein